MSTPPTEIGAVIGFGIVGAFALLLTILFGLAALLWSSVFSPVPFLGALALFLVCAYRLWRNWTSDR